MDFLTFCKFFSVTSASPVLCLGLLTYKYLLGMQNYIKLLIFKRGFQVSFNRFHLTGSKHRSRAFLDCDVGFYLGSA